MGLDDEGLLFDDDGAEHEEESEVESLLEMQEEEVEHSQKIIQIKNDEIEELKEFLKIKFEFQEQNIPDLKGKILLSAENFHQKGDVEKPLSLVNPRFNAEVRVRSRNATWYKFLEETIRICYPEIKGSLIQYGQIVCGLIIAPILNDEEINIKEINKRVNERKNKSARGTINARRAEIKKLERSVKAIQKEIRMAIFNSKRPKIDGLQTKHAHSKSIPAKKRQNKREKIKRRAKRKKKK
jgi:hypothetical protein